ncbi:protein containing duf1501 : Uncharacterized protein OS=Singulisphaera acidiphila (strain ATCC BAA-1392 / DSM 18658 / VKM B-2454 / MOB10) GN=Sinac_6931 PE=4 SV=1: DUF1501 [Gemmata massiliana]|uniref:DUF1501 domain-containing protein n=1 Tax=Gemmata massiliana TaxID=1210884 RepID=A0A6P2CVU8_9BACT|nr:DUF1501 domain-containing protein [Gemmata massiliana]VTR92285.1 protein containing duf1501 : Uncharacterized protein OS=Singulisphaera acidiphila (strain ATCC BAA-1392 / DSM 18658 / VKM B-2454 / MOB10) GN=Sinac_6931 PE=4 SV=1: DUF1501 [Gemmata massiliana]
MAAAHNWSAGRPVNRRRFLSDLGMGFTGTVLGTMLFEDGIAKEPAAAAKAPAKNVIWLFMLGGASHIETFDPKPALTKYADKTIAETPFEKVIREPRVTKNFRMFAGSARLATKILRPQVGFQKRGKCGTEVCDWLPHVGGCADDIAVVRSLWTTDFSHTSQMLFHTGRIIIDGREPCLGSWAHYGLGTLNRDLPKFVVMGRPPSDFGGGYASHQASSLGPEYDGVPIEVEPDRAVPYPPRGKGLTREAQKAEFELVGELNRMAAVEYPADPQLQARIKSYELAFRMQASLPDLVSLNDETRETKALYGLDDAVTAPFGRQCLAARKLVERGVRFVQIYHGGAADDDNGLWDSHQELRRLTAQRCREVDQPIAGLLKDLKRRGMLDSTLVVWATEFGRTPNVEPRPDGEKDSEELRGRDHHIYGFSCWLAGGGIKGGVVHGATDEIGFHAVEDRHYVTDIHATILHQLGLSPQKLELPGRRRLDLERGKPITEIIA